MTPRWAGFTAPFRWLVDAFDVGRHQPQVVIGAIVVTVLAGLLPSLPLQVMTIAGSPPSFAVQMLFQLIGLVVGLAITPVLAAGVYRIIEGAEQGRPVRIGQVFDGFSDGSWGRLALCAVLTFAIAVGLAVVVLLTMALVAGPELLQALQQWFEQVSAIQAKAAEAAKSGGTLPASAAPPPPAGMGSALAVAVAFLPLWCVIALGGSWALVSVALRGASPVAAVLGGLRAAFINAAPVLVFAVLLILPALLVMLVLGLVLVALVALFSLITPALGMIVAMLVTIALMLVSAAISYAFLLNGWRASCDDGAASAPSDPIAGIEA
jgi:hypothetical protein